MIYIYLLIIVLVLSIIGVLIKSKIPLKIITLVLILFSGFRYNVGTDYKNYQDIFTYEYGMKEIGYLPLIRFIKYELGGTQQLVFLLFSLFTILLIYKFIVRYSPYPYLSIITYVTIAPFYLASFSGIRHFLAISLFLYSIKYIIERKKVLFFIMIFFGSIFIHLSLLFLAPFYFSG